MLGSASRLRDALWSWTEEHAGIARQPATPDRNSRRTVVRTTLVAALTSSVYVAFGTVVWSAYDQFGLQSLRDVTPLVKARAAFVKLAPPHLTVRASEADRPPVVATFEPSGDQELPSHLSTALLRDGAADPPAPSSLSLPARARSAARAARPLVAPEKAPEQTFARAEARLEARSRPVAGSLSGGPLGRADLPSAAGSREELEDRPRGVGSRAQPPSSTTAIAASAPAEPGEPAEPGLTRPAAPKPSFKPRDVAVAWAAMERTSSSPVEGRDAAARPGPGPGSRATAAPGSRTPPLRPAFKPLDGARLLASGEPSRVAYAEGRSVLGSFWSRVRALFEPAPRRLIVAGNGSSRDADPGRSGIGGAADAPGRSGGDQPDQSAGSGGTGGGSTGGSTGGSSTAGSRSGSNTASNNGSRGSPNSDSPNSGSPSSNTGPGSVAGGVTGSVAGGVAGSVSGSVGASVGGRSVGASVGRSGNQGNGRSGGRGGDDDDGGRGRGDDDDDGGSGGGKGGGGKGGGGKGGDGKGGGGGGKGGGGKGGGGDDD